jgi:hypothetical protein
MKQVANVQIPVCELGNLSVELLTQPKGHECPSIDSELASLRSKTEVARDDFGRIEKRCAKLRDQLSKFGQKLLKLTGAVPPPKSPSKSSFPYWFRDKLEHCRIGKRTSSSKKTKGARRCKEASTPHLEESIEALLPEIQEQPRRTVQLAKDVWFEDDTDPDAMEWKPTKSSTGFLPLSAAATETIDSIPGLRESLLSQSATFKSSLRSTNSSQDSLGTAEHEPSTPGFSGSPVAPPPQSASSQISNTEASNNEAGDMASTCPPQPASDTDVEMEDAETEDTPQSDIAEGASQSDEPEKMDIDKNHCCGTCDYWAQRFPEEYERQKQARAWRFPWEYDKWKQAQLYQNAVTMETDSIESVSAHS